MILRNRLGERCVSNSDLEWASRSTRMVLMLFVCCVQPVMGAGPPGMKPPLSFNADEWYPSNLPTVMPPWAEIGLDIDDFRTISPSELLLRTSKLLTEHPPDSVESNLMDFNETNLVTTPLPSPTRTTVDINSIRGVFNSSEDSLEISEQNTTIGSNEEVISSQVGDSFASSSSNEEKLGKLNLSLSLTPMTAMDITTESTRMATDTSSDKIVGNDIGTTAEAVASLESECSDIFFVLDSSGNVAEQYEKQKNLINNVLMQLDDKDRHFGLMTYAGRTRQRINVPPELQISKNLFMRKLSRARFLSGVTATGAALQKVAQLDFPRRTDIVVVTDGFSFDAVSSQAQRLRERPQLRVLVTGNYSPVVMDVLNSIAGDPVNVLLGSRSTKQLLNLLRC